MPWQAAAMDTRHGAPVAQGGRTPCRSRLLLHVIETKGRLTCRARTDKQDAHPRALAAQRTHRCVGPPKRVSLALNRTTVYQCTELARHLRNRMECRKERPNDVAAHRHRRRRGKARVHRVPQCGRDELTRRILHLNSAEARYRLVCAMHFDTASETRPAWMRCLQRRLCESHRICCMSTCQHVCGDLRQPVCSASRAPRRHAAPTALSTGRAR